MQVGYPTDSEKKEANPLILRIAGFAAAGAAAVYFLDPKSGAERRQMVKDKLTAVLRPEHLDSETVLEAVETPA